jgi:5'-deoxynucleotidase YfbR-like HD superfamily hydrolase
MEKLDFVKHRKDISTYGKHEKALFTGRSIDFDNIDATDISIMDIAKGLGATIRWNGHTPRPITVARHSLWVAEKARKIGMNTPTQMFALLHDAHEAYLGDMGTMLKDMFPEVREMEAKIDNLIFTKYIGESFKSSTRINFSGVKVIDRQALRMEWENEFLGSEDYGTNMDRKYILDPSNDMRAFLHVFNLLANKLSHEGWKV